MFTFQSQLLLKSFHHTIAKISHVLLSILTRAEFEAPYLFVFTDTAFFMISSALSCRFGSIEVYIFSHHFSTTSLPYFSSRYSFT
jgi:hypothetical protein